jgi:hypothetical protein
MEENSRWEKPRLVCCRLGTSARSVRDHERGLIVPTLSFSHTGSHHRRSHPCIASPSRPPSRSRSFSASRFRSINLAAKQRNRSGGSVCSTRSVTTGRRGASAAAPPPPPPPLALPPPAAPIPIPSPASPRRSRALSQSLTNSLCGCRSSSTPPAI